MAALLEFGLFQVQLRIDRLADVLECLIQVGQGQPGRSQSEEGPGNGAKLPIAGAQPDKLGEAVNGHRGDKGRIS